MCEPLELAEQMGITLPETQKVPSWILGVSDSNPLTMAEAYATFGARGIHCDSLPVTSISDADGNLVKDYPQTCEQVMPGATADAVNDILRGVMEPGGFGQNIAIDKPSAGKTGTNNDNMSVWFAGYTPEIATAAMVAGADPLGNWVTLNGQSVGGTYISEAFGSTVAGPIWGDAMAAVSPKLDYTDFTTPSGDQIAGAPQRGARGERDDAGGGHRDARGGGLRRQRGRSGQLRGGRGPGGLLLPRQRHVAEQR